MTNCNNCDDYGKEWYIEEGGGYEYYYCDCLVGRLKREKGAMHIQLSLITSRDRYEYLWRTFTSRGRKLPYRGEVWRVIC